MDKRQAVDSIVVVSLFSFKAGSGKMKDIEIESFSCATCNENTKKLYRNKALKFIKKMPEWKPPNADVIFRLPIKYVFYPRGVAMPD